MSFLHPFLTDGSQSPQSVVQVSESGTGVVAGGAHRVGTRGALPDGRVFYYARSSGAAIVAGKMNQMPDVPTTFTDLAVGTELAGQSTLAVTPGAVTALEDAFAGGYCIIQDDTGEGQIFTVKSHLAVASATEFTVNIEGTIPIALGAGATVSMIKSPWADVIISGAAQDHMCVGVSNVAVPAGTTNPQHFWCQTWGVAPVWQDEASANGSALSSGTTAGQVELADATSDQIVGQLVVVAVDTEYTPTFLTIAP